MPDTVCAGQAQACLIRVARLNDEGAPLEGPDSLYISKGLIQLEWDPDVDDGDELESKNGCGESCVYLRADDNLRKLDLTLGLCSPEPELLEMLAGGTIHNLTGDTTGYGLSGTGVIGNVGDVSIELWVAIIVDSTIAGHARYVFSRTRGWRQTGGTHENDVLDVELEGWAFNNDGWGNGPGGDWDDLSEEAVKLYDWALEVNDLPEPSCGAQALALT